MLKTSSCLCDIKKFWKLGFTKIVKLAPSCKYLYVSFIIPCEWAANYGGCSCCCCNRWSLWQGLFLSSSFFWLCASLMSWLALDIMLLLRLGVIGISLILISSLYRKKVNGSLWFLDEKCSAEPWSRGSTLLHRWVIPWDRDLQSQLHVASSHIKKWEFFRPKRHDNWRVARGAFVVVWVSGNPWHELDWCKPWQASSGGEAMAAAPPVLSLPLTAVKHVWEFMWFSWKFCKTWTKSCSVVIPLPLFVRRWAIISSN